MRQRVSVSYVPRFTSNGVGSLLCNAWKPNFTRRLQVRVDPKANVSQRTRICDPILTLASLILRKIEPERWYGRGFKLNVLIEKKVVVWAE